MGGKTKAVDNATFHFSVNPILYWVTVIYGITRVVQWITNTDNFWSNTWNKLIDYAGDDPLFCYVWATSFYTIVLYWVVGSLFIIMDVTNKPQFFRKYKTQPDAHVPLDKWKFISASSRVLFNQFLVGIPYSYVLYELSKFVGMPGLRVVTSFPKLIFDLFIMGIVYELGPDFASGQVP